MQVTAFATPRHPDWRWRIVNYQGEVVEESQMSFPTIASAVAEGARRLQHMEAREASSHMGPSTWRRRG